MDQSGTDTPNFHIYDASAGSGKTYTLVRQYLIQLIRSKDPTYFKHILAITFTNKATAEMKQRIIDSLLEFSSHKESDEPGSMMTEIMVQTGLTTPGLKSRSRLILEHLFRNYGLFSVETIDSFNHRLLRTFASDLKLPGQFEVSLDTDEILQMAVDQLIDKAGTESALTELLINYALEKTDSDKSWDISFDLRNMAKLLSYDQAIKDLAPVLKKDLTDLVSFRETLNKRLKAQEARLQQLGQEQLDQFETHNLEVSHFNRGSVYNFFANIALGKFEQPLDRAWQRTLGERPPYTAKTPEPFKQIIEQILPDIIERFISCRELIISRGFYLNVIKNLNPLSVLKLIDTEIGVLEDELQILPIYKFNRIIAEKIKDQPAPFIYERLGERYRKFMIDEFQDTSFLQWNNLVPLIDNALSQQYQDGSRGELTLVGDAKQSIYRWRGGLPEQFIELHQQNNPFSGAKVEINQLPRNYRSLDEVVHFNNRFFGHASGFLSNPAYQKLYLEGNKQQTNNQPGGSVRLHFLDSSLTKDQKQEENLLEVKRQIDGYRQMGYRWSDIGVLTRKKEEGIALSSYLMELEIPVISGETLLLEKSPEVRVLVNMLKLVVNPADLASKFEVLDYFSKKFEEIPDKHEFISSGLHMTLDELEILVLEYGQEMPLGRISFLPLFEFFQACISYMDIDQNADGFLLEFMELVWSYSLNPPSGKIDFLEHWESNKTDLSLKGSSGSDAVQIMTIHKAKGLEFPVVIFPWADMKIADFKSHKVWVPWREPDETLDRVLINFNQGIRQYSEEIRDIYDTEIAKAQLDNLNLVYVALTRAIEHLSIITVARSARDQAVYTGEYFRSFLESEGKWMDGQVEYTFGDLLTKQHTLPDSTPQDFPVKVNAGGLLFDRINLASGRARLWNTETEAALRWGNLVHDTMAQVEHHSDLAYALDYARLEYNLDQEDLATLEERISSLINHTELSSYYKGEDQILNEREIYTFDGRSLRPDRINIHGDGSASVIDYKTGLPDLHHREQVSAYAIALEQMGYTVKNRIVIYSNSEGILINKE